MLIPMLNPDGVIVGNARCSLAGHDLNRVYSHPNIEVSPTVHSLKSLIKGCQEEHQVALFCDLHGHSRKSEIFMYGCEDTKGDVDSIRTRQFTKLYEDASGIFNSDLCSYSITKDKESTGRVVVYKELGVPHSFTLEASFCGVVQT